MMGLGPHIGRQYAHDLVYDICRKVIATGRPLCLPKTRRSPGTSTAPRSKSSAIQEIISAKPGKPRRRVAYHLSKSAPPVANVADYRARRYG